MPLDIVFLSLAFLLLVAALVGGFVWTGRHPDRPFAWNEPVEIRSAGRGRHAVLFIVSLTTGAPLLLIGLGNVASSYGAGIAAAMGMLLLAVAFDCGRAWKAREVWLRCDDEGLHGPHGALGWTSIARLRGNAFFRLPGAPLVVELNNGLTHRLPLPAIIARRAALAALYGYAGARAGLGEHRSRSSAPAQAKR